MSSIDYEDMISIDDLTEASMVQNTCNRYNKDCIYTWIGEVLVAVNPWKEIKTPPYINSVVERAYKNVLRDKTPQSILVSGESGSGKTESCKLILQHLVTVSGGSAGDIEKRIIEASPILEAFGNAQTVKNNNSSRFGKFIKVNFDLRGRMHSAQVEHYLLEKARVTRQEPGERNYGIFYMLVEGCSPEEKRMLFPHGTAFRYLAGMATSSAEKDRDAKHFARVKKAMGMLGLGEPEIREIFGVLSAIMHLGNIEFVSATTGGVATVADKKWLDTSARILGVTSEDLSKALTVRMVSAGNRTSTSFKQLTPSEASQSRDALAKALYGALFDWIVKFLNVKLANNDSEKIITIGVLDIFGFEIFEKNGFGQFLINYTNESLQHLFNQQLFQAEQQEYVREQVPWDEVEYQSNQPCVDLIEKKPTGLLFLIEEECILPHGSDAQLLQKMHAKHARSAANYVKPKLDPATFGIRHFAGEVMYEINGFLASNRDELHPDVANAMKTSSNPLIAFLTSKMQGYSNRASGTTVTSQFRQALFSLIKEIEASSVHWVRCLRPNKEKYNREFDAEFVLHQMRCVGMAQTVSMRKCGFSGRMLFTYFVEKYKIIMGPYASTAQGNPKQGVNQFLQHISPPTSSATMWLMGSTKIFLKDKILNSLETARIKREEEIRRREEEERKRREEEERKRKLEEERLRKLEEEKQRKLEEERKRKEEEERRLREEQERKRKEEEARKREAEERERVRKEEEKRKREEEDKKRQELAATERKKQELEEKKRREEEERREKAVEADKKREQLDKEFDDEIKKFEEEMQKEEEARRKREERVLWLEAERSRREIDKVKKRDDTKSPSPDPKRTQHKDNNKREEKEPETNLKTSQESPGGAELSRADSPAAKYDLNQGIETLLKTPSFVAEFTSYLTEAGFVDAIYCFNELQNYKTLQKGYLPSYARGIYYKYFVTQASRVGVDGLTVRDIAVKLTSPDATIFLKAEKQVLTFLEKQWLPGFMSNRDPKHVSFGRKWAATAGAKTMTAKSFMERNKVVPLKNFTPNTSTSEIIRPTQAKPSPPASPTVAPSSPSLGTWRSASVPSRSDPPAPYRLSKNKSCPMGTLRGKPAASPSHSPSSPSPSSPSLTPAKSAPARVALMNKR